MRLYLLYIPLVALIVTGCGFGIPTPASYPEPGWDFNKIVNDAKVINDDLDAYIRDFLDGNAGGNIPRSIMPYGADPCNWNLNGFYIVKGTDATNFSQRQFLYATEYMHDPNRPGWVVDSNRLGGAFRTGQSTYVCQWYPWIPWEHKMVFTGKFPHCRFFDIQVSSPFQPYVPYFKGYAGALETPIVDVDIEPDQGSVNPFRIGENRAATNRNYTVTYVMKSGRYIDFSNTYCPREDQYYRAAGNTRYASAIQYQGPWADPNFNYLGLLKGEGRWDFGRIWIRFYSPDKAYAPFAGGFDPNNNNVLRLVFYTPQNEPYYIYGSDATMMNSVACKVPVAITDAADPKWTELNDFSTIGHIESWWYGTNKQCDIGYTGYGAMVMAALGSGIGSLPSPYTDWRKYTRDCVKGFCGKGESQPDIGGWEASNSCVNYYSVIAGTCKVGSDKVSVLTGKLPTYNPTRNGETSNVAAQCRMWIFDLYSDVMDFQTNPQLGLNQQCLIDDEVAIDANRKYIIVMSTTENRPSNATAANGVTWLDNFGNKSGMNWRLRWMSVYPDWYMSPSMHFSPVGWKTLEQSSDFDPNYMGYNRHDGYMGWYLPKRHYMTRAEFEQLGNSINPDMVHTWRYPSGDKDWIEPYGWTNVFSVTNSKGSWTDDIWFGVTIPSLRYVRVRGDSYANHGWDISELMVIDSNGVNLALSKTVTISDSSWYKEKTVNGNYGDEWCSNDGNNIWIVVDLGATYSNINQIVVQWRSDGWGCTSYGVNYQFEASTNGSTWSTIKSITNGDAGRDCITSTAAPQGKYLLFHGVHRYGGCAYDMKELYAYDANNVNIALNRPVRGSGYENYTSNYPANAVDGSLDNHWHSSWNENGWLYVDFGGKKTLSHIAITWHQDNGAKDYDLKVSDEIK